MQTDRLQSMLDMIDAPVCDDCLAPRANMPPRDVAETCQQLADRGDVDREQGRCTVCGRTKIVNSPIASRNMPG